MVRTLILALALSATDGFAPATKGIQRVAPMNMETMPYSSPAAQSSSGPGPGPRESPKNAPGADSTILVQGGSLRTWSYKSPLVNQLRPFSCVIATPRGPNTVAIRNIGQMEFPIAADVYANDVENPSAETAGSATTIQGGALRTYPFDPLVNSTPGSGNVVRIVNTAPAEFPMTAAAPHSIDDKMASGAFDGDVVIGGDIGW
ncbi:hypothetical protein JL721_3779 [Aureococcus anophagefferens]|nr:hypothetical protein JL721_3779 [Aureococcus anophagefferens]